MMPWTNARASRLLAGGAACLLAVSGLAAGPESSPASLFPPWSHESNDPVHDRGLEFTVPEVDNLPDFHGDPVDARLNLFVGGNYFFAMAPLVAEFVKQYPQYKDHVYYETIPPGLLIEQIRKGGRITVGNMTWTVHADVYVGGLGSVNALVRDGDADGPVVPYAKNTLAIMVPKGNPAKIAGLADLARPGLRLVMPNPAYEDIGRPIQATLAKAGGDELVKAVYEAKVRAGETVLTRIHHRQTPLYLMLGRAEAGVTWQSEAIFQEQIGNPIAHVVIPDEQNVAGTYAAAVLRGAPHREAGQRWVDFLHSPAALAIFESYGFQPYAGN